MIGSTINKTNEVSIIVPVYNGADSIEKLIESLLQLNPAPGEIIIVDNNSTDGTLAKLRQLAAAFSGLCDFHLLEEKSVQTSYAARNRGIRSSRGEILLFTDADCQVSKTWVAVMTSVFAEKPEAGIICGKIYGHPGHTTLEQYAMSTGILTTKHTQEHFYMPYGVTANLGARRKVFEAVGLFRPHITSGGDADFCWRVQKETSWQLEFNKEASVKHYHRSTLRGFIAQFRKYGIGAEHLRRLHDFKPPTSIKSSPWFYLTKWPIHTKWRIKKALSSESHALVAREFCFAIIDTIKDMAYNEGRRNAIFEEKLKEIPRL